MEQPTFDYVVIGAGTAGSLLANRLSADPARRVLLREAGARDDYLRVHIPVGYLYSASATRVPTGSTRPSRSPISMAAGCAIRAERCSAAAAASTA